MLKRLIYIIAALFMLGLVFGCDKDEGNGGGGGEEGGSYEDFDPSSYDGLDTCTQATYALESAQDQCKAGCDCVRQHPAAGASDNTEMLDDQHSMCMTACESQ